MDSKKDLQNNILSSLTAVAAGVLTEIIYNLLAENYYRVEMTEESIGIFQVSKLDNLIQIGIILGVFLLSWLLITCLLPVICYVLKSLFPHSRPKSSRKTILNTYREFKNDLLEIQEKLYYRGNLTDAERLALFCHLCCIITTMHKVFNFNKRAVKSAFRPNADDSTNDIGVRISSYEYRALIESAQTILSQLYRPAISEDALYSHDYDKAKNHLEELRACDPGK